MVEGTVTYKDVRVALFHVNFVLISVYIQQLWFTATVHLSAFFKSLWIIVAICVIIEHPLTIVILSTLLSFNFPPLFLGGRPYPEFMRDGLLLILFSMMELAAIYKVLWLFLRVFIISEDYIIRDYNHI